MKPIAYFHCDLKTKFGVPRQSGLVRGLVGRIVFEPAYRNADALRGLEGFSHIWMLWDFSETHNSEEDWSPTVRPPRLGGNRRVGVFATRSPFRPNPIGLSAVAIRRIEYTSAEGPIIYVEGADLMDGTPIWDIKPYLPLADCIPMARSGFAKQTATQKSLDVNGLDSLGNALSTEQKEVLSELLAADPRPRYQDDPNRIYVMEYADMEVKFKVDGDQLNIVPPQDEDRRQAVVFDLGGVVVDLEVKPAIMEFAKLGLIADGVSLEHLSNNGLPKDWPLAQLMHAMDRGEIDGDTFVEQLRSKCKPGTTDEEVLQAFNLIIGLRPQRLQWLSSLRRHYRVFLLSNIGDIHWQETRRKALETGIAMEDCFDGFFLSYKMRLAKPDARIYDQLIEQTGIDPSTTLYVDDLPDNIEAGKRAGLQAYKIPCNGLDEQMESIERLLREHPWTEQ